MFHKRSQKEKKAYYIIVLSSSTGKNQAMVTEIKQYLAGAGCWLKRGPRECLMVMNMFYILIGLVVTQCIKCQSHHTLYLKSMHCIVCKMHLNKPILNNCLKLLKGTLAVCLPARFVGLHHPPSSSFLSFLMHFSELNQVGDWYWTTIWSSMKRTWEVSMGSTVKSGALNHQLGTTLEIAMTHANFKQDKIMQ